MVTFAIINKERFFVSEDTQDLEAMGRGGLAYTLEVFLCQQVFTPGIVYERRCSSINPFSFSHLPSKGRLLPIYIRSILSIVVNVGFLLGELFSFRV